MNLPKAQAQNGWKYPQEGYVHQLQKLLVLSLWRAKALKLHANFQANNSVGGKALQNFFYFWVLSPVPLQVCAWLRQQVSTIYKLTVAYMKLHKNWNMQGIYRLIIADTFKNQEFIIRKN